MKSTMSHTNLLSIKHMLMFGVNVDAFSVVNTETDTKHVCALTFMDFLSE